MVAQLSYKPKIDNLILNYFIQEGYKDAALTFARETDIDLSQEKNVSTFDSQSLALLKELNSTDPEDKQAFLRTIKGHSLVVQPHNDQQSSLKTSNISKGFSTINERKEIKYLILKGSITSAIEKISEYFPSVLDSNNLLHFKLLRLNLIEMIRTHRLTDQDRSSESEKKFLGDILTFVRTNLINKVTKSFKLLKELEITMSLLCFNYDPSLGSIEEQKDLPEELRSFFDLSLRTQCYKLVNRAILNLLSESDEEIRNSIEEQARYEQLKESTQSEFNYSTDNVDHNDLQEYVQEEVEDSDTDSLSSISLEEKDALVKKEQSPMQDEASEDEANKLEALAYESKLEKLIKLWAVTEHRLQELEIIKEKRLHLE